MSDPKSQNQSSAPADDANTAKPNETAAPEQLSKEEQWALFEKELKESDWGHQPC